MKKSVGKQALVYPTPVFLVGTYDEHGKANIMTAAWGGICSSEPLCIAVSVRPVRYTADAIIKRKSFTISLATKSIIKQADYAGIVSGRRVDKFSELGLHAERAEFVDAPFVQESPVIIECSLYKTIELGVHTQFIGEVQDVKINEEMLTADGKPDIEKISPAMFAPVAGLYYGLGECLGKGFSIGKEFLKKGQGLDDL